MFVITKRDAAFKESVGKIVVQWHSVFFQSADCIKYGYMYLSGGTSRSNPNEPVGTPPNDWLKKIFFPCT